MRVGELVERLLEFPDYYDVPGVEDVRAETRVVTVRDRTGAGVRDASVVVVLDR